MMILKQNQFGVNMMIIVFALSFYSVLALDYVDVAGVSYTSVPVLGLENQLIEEIKLAKLYGWHFYIGVASAHGSPIQSLCYRAGSSGEKPDAKTCNKPRNHDVDNEAINNNLELIRVFYPGATFEKKKVCAIERKLIAEYKDQQHRPPTDKTILCLNKAQSASNGNCINYETGIVYLRIYANNYVDVAGVSYKSVPVLGLENQLIEEIKVAKLYGWHFYIGAASAHGSPIQSLCYRAGSRGEKPDAKTCNKPRNHDVDNEARNNNLELIRVFYPGATFEKKKVCAIERSLIAKHKDKLYGPEASKKILCLNKSQSAANGNCIRHDTGIVYLRIYADAPK